MSELARGVRRSRAIEPISGRRDVGRARSQGPLENPVIVARATAAHARLSPAAVRYARRQRRLSRRRRIVRCRCEAQYRRHRGRRSADDDNRKARAIGLAVHIAARRPRLPYLDEMLGREPCWWMPSATRHRPELHRHRSGGVRARRRPGRSADAINPDGTAARRAVLAAYRARFDFDGGDLLDRPNGLERVLGPGRQARHARATVQGFSRISASPEIPKINGGIARRGIGRRRIRQNVVLAGLVRADRADEIGGREVRHGSAASSPERCADARSGAARDRPVGHVRRARRVLVAGGSSPWVQYAAARRVAPYLGTRFPGTVRFRKRGGRGRRRASSS